MSFKHILLHLDATEQCAKRVEIAFNLAKKENAHVRALFCQPTLGYRRLWGNIL